MGTPVTLHNLFHTIDGLVAVGTIGLASFTAILAGITVRVASLTKRDVAVSRASVEGSIRPVLIDVRRPTAPTEIPSRGGIAIQEEELGWDGTQEVRNVPYADAFGWEDNDSVYLSVPLRNAGLGIAFLRGVSLVADGANPSGLHLTAAVVPPSEKTRVQITVPRTQDFDLVGLRGRGGFSVHVSYTDVHGQQMTLTRADVNWNRDHWQVAQIFLSEKKGEKDGSIIWSEPVHVGLCPWRGALRPECVRANPACVRVARGFDVRAGVTLSADER